MSKVLWSEIKYLAKRVDTVFDNTLKASATSTYRTSDKPCRQFITKSSLVQGIPELANDITTPFTTAFPIRATLYQRFEFGYEDTDFNQTTDYFHEYLSRARRAVLHSVYLTTAANAPSNSYLTIDKISTPKNLTYLIESPLHKIYQWWTCGKMRETDEISAELYFVSDSKSICPCPATYRVAWANCSANGNGNSYMKTDRPIPSYIKESHKFTIDLSGNTTGVVSEDVVNCVTLNELTFDNLKPEFPGVDQDTCKTYAAPTNGCCYTVKFPIIGQQAGGDEHHMFDSAMFYDSYSAFDNITKPFTEHSTMSLAEYNSIKDTLPVHAQSFELDKYDAASYFENWPVCKEGGSAVVRITLLAFTYHKIPNNLNSEKMVSLRYVPTSVTRTIAGEFRPAIRKRWYNMLYHKLANIAGTSYSDTPGTPYIGTAWTKTHETFMASLERPCSRWLAMGYGWTLSKPLSQHHQAFFGEKYFERMICIKNYTGKAIKCSGAESGIFNSKLGCFCTPSTSLSNDDCYDIACYNNLSQPWDGGCHNNKCKGNNVTHRYSFDALSNICTTIETMKRKEDFSNIEQVLSYEACTMKLKAMNPGFLSWSQVELKPGQESGFGDVSVSFPTYEEDTSGCTGCIGMTDPNCPVTITTEYNNGFITVAQGESPKPVVASLVYGAFIRKKNSIQIGVSIPDINDIVVKESEYIIIANTIDTGDGLTPDNILVWKKADYDALPDDEKNIKQVIMPPNPAGTISITAYYGPIGTTMRVAGTRVLTNSASSTGPKNISFNVNAPIGVHQYRLNVVLYIECWLFGEAGAASPYNLILEEPALKNKIGSISINVS